jgi:general secretion pathway protein D
LANLPLIGRLFSNNNQDKRKNEIVLLITPRIMHNLSPASSVYSLIPSGIAATANPIGAGGARAVQASEPVSATPAVTPQTTQSNNVRNDSGFANQMMNSTDTGTVQP